MSIKCMYGVKIRRFVDIGFYKIVDIDDFLWPTAFSRLDNSGKATFDALNYEINRYGVLIFNDRSPVPFPQINDHKYQ